MSEALTHMIETLGLEIAAIRKKGGRTQIELRGGELVGQAEGSRLYRFVVAEDLSLRNETPVRVTAGQEAARVNLAAREQKAERHRAQAARARSNLERVQNMGTVRRFSLGLDPERLTRVRHRPVREGVSHLEDHGY